MSDIIPPVAPERERERRGGGAVGGRIIIPLYQLINFRTVYSEQSVAHLNWQNSGCLMII